MVHRPNKLNNIRKVHLVGIKGVGMSTIAYIAQDMGMKVTGSDVGESFVTERILTSRNIPIKSSFSPANIDPDTDLVIVTAAHGGMTNPEAKSALTRGIKVWMMAEAIGHFMQGKIGISVCGVGGKTTTSAMAALMLDRAGAHPSFSVGVGSIKHLKAPGKYDKGKHFVVEADEYASCPVTDKRPKFYYQKPHVVILTNLRFDHPDIYNSFLDTKAAFESFLNKVPPTGMVITSRDNPANYKLVKSMAVPATTYGTHPASEWLIKNHQMDNKTNNFDLYYHQKKEASLSLQVPGLMNALNASAVYIMGRFLGIPSQKIIPGLAEFASTKRRFEKIYTGDSYALYDDYAHHPDEIVKTIQAAKAWFGNSKRIVVIFEPHTFSRTKQLFQEFITSMQDIDLGYVIDIYGSAREPDDPTISSEQLVKAISKTNPNIHYRPTVSQVIPDLKKRLKPGDIVFTMGAGDIYKNHHKLIKLLKQL